MLRTKLRSSARAVSIIVIFNASCLMIYLTNIIMCLLSCRHCANSGSRISVVENLQQEGLPNAETIPLGCPASLMVSAGTGGIEGVG